MPKRLYHKVSILLHLPYLQFSLALNCKVLPGRSVLHYTTLHILASTSPVNHDILFPISFFIIFQTFSLEFISSEFPGHSRTGIPLHSRNVLALLELWHGARSCIKICHFCGNPTYSHESVFHSHNNRHHCRDWSK